MAKPPAKPKPPRSRAKAKVRYPHALVVTQKMRDDVREMASFLMTREAICTIMGLGSKHTLLKHFQAELDMGDAMAQRKIGRSLMVQGTGAEAEIDEVDGKKVVIRPAIPADKSVAIFLGKAKLGLKDREAYLVPLTEQYDLTKLGEEDLVTLERILRQAQRRPANDDAAGDGGGAAGDAPGERPAGRPARGKK